MIKLQIIYVKSEPSLGFNFVECLTNKLALAYSDFYYTVLSRLCYDIL